MILPGIFHRRLALLPATFLVLLSRTAGARVVAAYFLRSLQASSLRHCVAYGDERLGVRPVRVVLLPFRALFLSPPDLFGAIEVEQVRSQIAREARSPLPDHSREFLEAAVHLLADHSAVVCGAHGLQAALFSRLLVER